MIAESLLILLPILPLAVAGNHLDERNLNYRSPYLNLDYLAADTHTIAKRHEASYEILRKRAFTEKAPDGEPNSYELSGYGLGAVDWSDAQYIYNGDLNFSTCRFVSPCFKP